MSNGNKVLNLNADSVDGLDGAALSNDTKRYTYNVAGLQFSSNTYTISQVPAGTYLMTLRTNVEPAGAPTDIQCWITVAGQDYAGDMVRFWARTRSSARSVSR